MNQHVCLLFPFRERNRAKLRVGEAQHRKGVSRRPAAKQTPAAEAQTPNDATLLTPIDALLASPALELLLLLITGRF